MAVLSPFQTLPAFVVEQILDYLLDNPGYGFNQKRGVGLSLLHSCNIWRSLFIRKALADLKILLSTRSEAMFEYPKWPKDAAMPDFPTNHLVKKINIVYNGRLYGNAKCDMEVFQSFLPSDSKFESVYRIDLSISLKLYSERGFILQMLYNILSHLRVHVRYASRVVVDFTGTQSNRDSRLFWFFANNVFYYIEGIPGVTFDDITRYICHYSKEFHAFDNLTSFSFNGDINPEAYSQVIRRCANTLRTLHADYESAGNMDDILYDSNNTPIVYPYMRYLKMFFSDDENISDITSETVHFPVVKKIVLQTRNQNYLEILYNNRKSSYHKVRHLRVFDQYGAVNYLQNCYAFKGMQLTDLQTFVFDAIKYDLNGDYANQDEADKTRVEFIGLVLNAAIELRCLYIQGVLAGNYFMRLLAVPHRFAFLRKLDISRIELPISDILALLMAAPLLTLLDVTLKDTHPLIDGIISDELVTYVESNFANVGRNMHRIRMSYSEDDDLPTYCEAIALLVVVCPNLVYLLSRSYDVDDIRENLLWISQIKKFSKYSYNLEMVARRMIMPNNNRYQDYISLRSDNQW